MTALLYRGPGFKADHASVLRGASFAPRAEFGGTPHAAATLHEVPDVPEAKEGVMLSDIRPTGFVFARCTQAGCLN